MGNIKVGNTGRDASIVCLVFNGIYFPSLIKLLTNRYPERKQLPEKGEQYIYITSQYKMTSLAEQLRQLAIPQALQQKEIKNKASLLFNEHEASSLNRDTLYDIGLDGLKELISLDGNFAQFSENLYHLNSRLFERTTQSKEANKKLDQTIKKFLQLLSPYVLLKPAHKALEWLVARYHIQDLNTNDLMALVLPYHETKFFAKVLQLINLDLPSSKQFSWLLSIQKEGVHLPKLVLINHVISDSSLLRFICETFINTVKEHNNIKRTEKLVSLVNFYYLTLVNTLSRKEVNDQHLTVILPSLIFALKSQSLIVKSAAYMICGQLVALHELSQSLLDDLIKYIIDDIKEENKQLQKERVLLLILIFQKQNHAKLPDSFEKKFPFMKDVLTKLEDDGVQTEPFIKNLKELGLKNEFVDKVKVPSCSTNSDLDVYLNYFQELKECQEDKKESVWLKLRPNIIDKVENSKIFKALCKYAPSYDKLVLMVCLDKIMKKGSKQNQLLLVSKILKSNFGNNNPYIMEISNSLQSEKSLQDIVVSFVSNQNKEYGNPVEFEPWLVAMNELKNVKHFRQNYDILKLGLRILIASLPPEFNPTPALQILQFLKSLQRKKVKIRFKVLHAVIDYIKSGGIKPCEWYDLSSKNPEIWLKVRILEYILEGVFKDKSSKRKYVVVFNHFFKSSFHSKENFTNFVSAICAGTPFQVQGGSEFSISPALQIYTLHSVWYEFKSNKDPSDFLLQTAGSRAFCYVLICLSSPFASIRRAAFEVIGLISQYQIFEESLFYRQLFQRKQEILRDHEQLIVTIYYLLSPKKSVQATLDQRIVSTLTDLLNILLDAITSEDTPLYVSSKILSIMEAVNSEEIIIRLVKLCIKAIGLCKESAIPRSILSNFWSRINEETAAVLEKPEVWDLAVKCLKHPKCDDLNPAVSFSKAITKEVFEKLSENRKFELLQQLISTRSETDCNEISSSIASAVKRINIDSNIILPLIKKMTAPSGSPKKNREEKSSSRPESIVERKDWKTGISLLELIQSKKKLQNSELLLKPLSDVLQFCFTQEDQTSFEYAKQLVLGCLLHCCQKLSTGSQNVDDSSLNADLVVQCLRASPNPQTHHHALLLLSCLAAIVPNQVMHNIMAIFTFMGTSVTRLDDEHSVKIVTQVVDAVVPVLMKSMSTNNQDIEKVMAKILIVFVWALKDIPQHRRKPLFLQLVTTLQPEKSLWILLLLLIENYVLQGNLARTEGLPANLFLGLQLTLSMTPNVIVESVLKILQYLNGLPPDHLNKDGILDKMKTRASSKKSESLFETEIKTTKQLRQFVYTILTFLNNLLSNNNFIMQITEENTDENSLEPAFRDIIAYLMRYIQTSKQQYELEHDKFWKAVIHQCYEMLDKFVSLVPTEMLLTVIKNLLHHSLGTLRRKALDLFNVLLQSKKEDFNESEKDSLIDLLKSILEIIHEIGDNTEQETEILQQTALISLKLLTKLLSSENLPLFKEVLVKLCGIAKNKRCEGHLLGSVMIAISDQVVYLKVHAMSQLPVFLPLMLQIFSDNINREKISDLGLISVTTALYKVVDALPHFLSPYLHKILYNVCIASVHAPDNTDLSKKLMQIRQKIANNVESRVLIPSVANCYDNLISENMFEATGPLLLMLSTNFSASPDVGTLVADLTKFFFNALNFRTSAETNSNKITLDDIDKVEGFVIESLVQLVLKLSESSFRPLYYQLCHWASEHKERNISFFRLSCRLAENLKGLFVLFAGHFLHNAANLLDAVNVTKAESSYFGDAREGETKSILLLENILKTLHLVFLYDSGDTSNFLNKDKFEVLLHPLVDQLENTLGGVDAMEERRTRLLTPCLAQMALATDDTLWKSLNYQILVKTKSNLPQVRIGGLQTIVAMAAKLGEDYLILLPETIGSLAELLEDEDEKVEDAMKKAVQQLEEVLGQPIREYFQQ